MTGGAVKNRIMDDDSLFYEENVLMNSFFEFYLFLFEQNHYWKTDYSAEAFFKEEQA
jgi:hypothetical protein